MMTISANISFVVGCCWIRLTRRTGCFVDAKKASAAKSASIGSWSLPRIGKASWMRQTYAKSTTAMARMSRSGRGSVGR